MRHRVFVPPVECWQPEEWDIAKHCESCVACAREFIFFQFSTYFFFDMEGIVVDEAAVSETVEKPTNNTNTKKRQRTKKEKVKVSCERRPQYMSRAQ